MRKLMFVSNLYPPNVVGGAELTVQTLARELVRRGHEVSVVTSSLTGQDTVDTLDGVRVYRMAIANVYTGFTGQHHPALRAAWHAIDVFNPAQGWKLDRILARERPDWVSANNIAGLSTAVWAAVKARGIGLSQVLHDYWAICPKTTMNKGGTSCATPCTSCSVYGAPKKLTSRLPDVVIGVSRFVVQRHRELGFFAGVRPAVVYNGSAYEPPRERIPRDPGAPLRVGFVGRVEPVKGIEVLLSALSRLPADRWRLRVAGRPNEASYLEDLKRRFPLPQVEYLGYVPSEQLYRSIDVFVAPSVWNEPLPTVVYEALGYGVPVIASRVGGIPEILDDDTYGWLFEPGDVDALERRLRSCLDGWTDPQRVWEGAIRRRQFFMPARQADDFLAVIEGRDAWSSESA
jgi:glycosyltransferase involved in cell wall biosynthesis